MTPPTKPARELSELFKGASFHLPLGYGPLKGHDLASLRGLLSYACDMANQTLIRTHRTVQLAELLEAAVDGHPDLVSPSEQRVAAINAQLERATRLVLRRTPGGVRWDTDVGPDGANVLLAALFMVPEYRGLLKRCARCRRVFVREGKRRFCGPECAIAVNDAGAKERKRRQRLVEYAKDLPRPVASVDTWIKALKQAQKNHPDAATPEQLAAHAKALLQPSRKHK